MNEKATYITGGKIILDHEVLTGKVLIFRDKIMDIIDAEEFEIIREKKEMNVINAGGKYVSPGFIDVHIHGAGGADVMDGQLAGLDVISESIVQNGVTGFLPTTMSMGWEDTNQALNVIRQSMMMNLKGAKVLGAHMEGPFINPTYKGAQNKAYILLPDSNWIKKHFDILKIITLAPEMDENFEFVKYVKETSDIVLSLGHTNASYETAMKGIDAGIESATHLFNAMAPFHHRAPGPVGAVLNSNVYFELIADILHIHPALFQMLLRAKSHNKMVLVTDGMRASGMHPGTWELGGQEVFVNENSARLSDGTLAGSILKMNVAVQNMMKHTNLKIFEAVALASLNPAKLIHLEKSKGSIEIGKDADIIIFDEELKIAQTIIGGQVVYKA